MTPASSVICLTFPDLFSSAFFLFFGAFCSTVTFPFQVFEAFVFTFAFAFFVSSQLYFDAPMLC